MIVFSASLSHMSASGSSCDGRGSSCDSSCDSSCGSRYDRCYLRLLGEHEKFMATFPSRTYAFWESMWKKANEAAARKALQVVSCFMKKPRAKQWLKKSMDRYTKHVSNKNVDGNPLPMPVYMEDGNEGSFYGSIKTGIRLYWVDYPMRDINLLDPIVRPHLFFVDNSRIKMRFLYLSLHYIQPGESYTTDNDYLAQAIRAKFVLS